jgi:hypothetical protein
MSKSHRLPARLGYVLAGGMCLVLIGQLAAASGDPFTAHHASGYLACASAKRALVVSSHGACPHGTHRVTLGATGRRGPSDVYVSSKRTSGALTTEALKMPVPAGHYDATWTVDATGQFSNPGAPTGQQYAVHIYCVPGVDFKGTVGTFGQDDTEDFTIEPDNYSISTDTSEFSYDHTLTGSWAVTLDPKEALVVSCNISASDGSGNPAGPDSQLWTAQIVATRIGAIHTVKPATGS